MERARHALSIPRYGHAMSRVSSGLSDSPRDSGSTAQRAISAEKISTVTGQVQARKPLPRPNRTIAMSLFSGSSRHADRAGAFLRSALTLAVPGRRTVFVRAEGICDLQQLRSVLRAIRSTIGGSLSLIVAIAAASLPAAGA